MFLIEVRIQPGRIFSMQGYWEWLEKNSSLEGKFIPIMKLA